MLSISSPGHSRLAPEVPALRQKMPYFNYGPSALSHAHPAPAPDVHTSTSNWTGPRGYGGRHRLDDAPFSLWDEAKHDFRLPTSSESAWLVARYKASAIDFQFPIIVIETADPPKLLPLTVATVAVNFVSPPSTPVARNASGMRLEPLYDARPIGFPTNYAGMRGPKDPLQFTFRKWIEPTNEELKSLVDALFRFCNPRMVHILCFSIIIELRVDDQRTYKSGSLPRRIGGFSAHYHHSLESAFEGLSVQGRERLISPTASTQDNSNYLQVYNELCPGVRVESGEVTNMGQYAQFSMSTTAGILVRDNHGNQRLTVSNHGFPYGNEVFHPSNNGVQIGVIDERWESLDIALVKLNPSVEFTNDTYFEAKRPRRLLRSQDIPLGTFFSVDGMSTGLVYMQTQGLSLDIPPRPQNCPDITFAKLRVYRGFGAMAAVPRDGLCGAALVEDDSEEGGIAGFFQNGNSYYALSPCLDEFIDSSWGVV